MSKIEMVVGVSKVRVGLDKFVLGIPYPKLPQSDEQNPPSQNDVIDIEETKKVFHAKLKHIGNMIKETGNHHVSNTKNKDLKRYHVLSEDDGSLICVFALGFTYGTGIINLEINPSKMTTDKWGELHALLAVSFDGHYLELYEHSVVSHAEFFVDVHGEDLSKLVLIDEGRRATTLHKGTTYHGRRTSRLVATMYDKAKEQKQDGQLVRVEVRLNRRDKLFCNIVEHDLFNPFGTLLVVDVNQMQSISAEWQNPQLANQINEWGLYEAVKNKHARKKILAGLKEVVVPWWEPDLFWASHKKLLLQFKPGHAGGFA